MSDMMGSMRPYVILTLLVLIYGSFAFHPAQKRPGIRKVVIDAGHGGHDPGTVGKHSREKDIALAISLRLGKMISEQFQSVEVIYTRRTDVFVELYQRARIANESKADLFISVHCNGTRSTAAHGTETWVMGLHKSKENLEVAKKENASILMEDNYAAYDGFDPNSPEANIIFSLYQNLYLDQSLDIANRIQQHFQNGLGLVNRGVKQAGFWVLYKTTMPGILVEAGFLSNPSDEAYLVSEKGQQEIAAAIFSAFSEYKQAVETGGQVLEQVVSGTSAQKPLSTRDPVTGRPGASGPVAPEPAAGPDPRQAAAKASQETVVYKVQIISAPKKLPARDSRLRGVEQIAFYQHQGLYKYTAGEFNDLNDALKYQAALQAKGWKDAFVVAFHRGKRITIEESRQILRN